MRGIGLMWGIDFARIPGASKEMITACFERGLVIERAGRGNDVLKIMPPLIISDDNLQKGLEIVKEALQAVLAAHPAQ